MQETWVPSLGWEDSPGEEKGYPRQYSGLENFRDCIKMLNLTVLNRKKKSSCNLKKKTFKLFIMKLKLKQKLADLIYSRYLSPSFNSDQLLANSVSSDPHSFPDSRLFWSMCHFTPKNCIIYLWKVNIPFKSIHLLFKWRKIWDIFKEDLERYEMIAL